MAFDPMGLPHESADVRFRRVVLLAYGFVVFAVVLAGLLSIFYRASIPNKVAAPFKLFPGPRLQPNPSEDYVLFHRSQVEQLAGTSWVDRTKGLVHVPIERAMAFVAAKGNAAFDPLEPAADQKPPPTPQDGAPRANPTPDIAPFGQGKQPRTLQR